MTTAAIKLITCHGETIKCDLASRIDLWCFEFRQISKTHVMWQSVRRTLSKLGSFANDEHDYFYDTVQDLEDFDADYREYVAAADHEITPRAVCHYFSVNNFLEFPPLTHSV